MKLLDKPEVSTQVSIGDVITSYKFKHGHRNGPGSKLLVGGKVAANSIDESRASAKYVVIKAGLQVDRTGMSSFPDGWAVTARRLDKNMLDTGDGEEIRFFQYFINGSASYALIDEVLVHGHMEQRFV